MTWFTLFVILTLPLSVSAQTFLECHQADGRNGVKDAILATVSVSTTAITLSMTSPVKTVSFDIKKGVKGVARDVAFTTYTKAELDESYIAFQIDDAGKVRLASLTIESSPMSEDPSFQFIPMKCFE